ncbi:MAG: DUF1016 N-terminal domain-containing protein, partial [Prosthecobacter sp.]|nr:DUF1016 N-terminal domain-containing protein [Prosthecobacter sp.]
MSKPKRKVTAKEPEALFGRVVSILDEARGNVVRAVNSNMVLAYWLIGREIVQELQGGEKRAAYGKKVVEDLSARLTERYGQGFSVTNLWYFRQFHLAFQDRLQILHPLGGESLEPSILRPAGGETSGAAIPSPLGRELAVPQKSRPTGDESPQGFSPQLTWSHYRALMRV